MASAETRLRQQYAAVSDALKATFPHVPPQDPSWIFAWLEQYPLSDIEAAIQTLSQHQPEVQARFTKESVGKAITALLKQQVIRRITESVSGSRS